VLIMLRALDGLHYAHTFCRSNGAPGGVLHRDISPGNILLDLEGQVKLLDFGIARRLEGDAAQYQTREGVLSGKTGYLAPELFSNVPSSVASDLYACGVVLYYVLTGVHPFLSETEYHTMWRVLEETPQQLRTLRDDLPPELEAVVLRSLAKQPAERHASARELAADLRRLLTRSEAELQSALRQRLRQDFSERLPALLQLEPLEQRERAWSADLDGGAADLPLRSSVLPGALREAPTVIEVARGSGAHPRSPGSATTPQPDHPARAPAWQRSWPLGALALLLGGAILVAQRGGDTAPAQQRFIVVESPQAAAGPEAAAGAEPPGTASTTIARQLARRQAALHACFQEAGAAAPQAIEATLHFDVAATGSVRAATLEPLALEKSAVGQCVLRVARETTFQDLAEPVRFSVPLRTRPGVK
jgi:serine/threonine-protein kinase